MKANITTIQATGKKWKLFKRFGGWLLVIGIFLYSFWLNKDPARQVTLLMVLPMLLGGVFYVIGGVGKWWNHE